MLPDLNFEELINNVPLDLRAEVVVADLLRNNLSPDEIFIRPMSNFKRPHSRDISGVEKNHAGKKESIFINTNRDGLYDALPQMIFHGATNKKPKAFKSVNEMVLEVKQRMEEEKAARDFFLPYEIEFFRQRTYLESEERDTLDNLSLNMQSKDLIAFWNFPDNFSDRQKGTLFYLLPILHKIIGDLHLMTLCYKSVLGVTIALEIIGAKRESVPDELSLPLRMIHLGTDFIIGDTLQRSLPLLKIKIGPLNKKEMFEYILYGKGKKVLNKLNEFFIPAEITPEIELIINENDDDFILDQVNESGRLAYTTVI
jgi:type VI secretion system protein ImpH